MTTKAERAAAAAKAAAAKAAETTLPTGKVEAPDTKPGRAGAKITVCCNVPNGLRLRLFEFVDASEQVLGGGTRTYKIAQPIQRNDRSVEVLIKGPSVPHGVRPDYLIVGGYALTQNVDKDFFDEWMRQNKDTQLVKNRAIFANESPIEAEAQARDNRDAKSGLEPLDMSMVTGKDGKVRASDKRVPRPTSQALDPLRTIEKTDHAA